VYSEVPLLQDDLVSPYCRWGVSQAILACYDVVTTRSGSPFPPPTPHIPTHLFERMISLNGAARF
jgi:hypothetical protein